MIAKEMTEMSLLLLLTPVSVPEALLSAEDARPPQEPPALRCNTHQDPSVAAVG